MKVWTHLSESLNDSIFSNSAWSADDKDNGFCLRDLKVTIKRVNVVRLKIAGYCSGNLLGKPTYDWPSTKSTKMAFDDLSTWCSYSCLASS